MRKNLEIPRHFQGNGRSRTIVLRPGREGFQVKAKIQRRLRNGKRRIQKRLRKKQWADQRQRMFRNQNVHYDIAAKSKALAGAGLGAILLLVQQLALADSLNMRLHLLKRHVPYFESDHILNLTYNLLMGGKVIEDLELLRNNEVYLNTLGAQRIPDPTTAGDFLRRFKPADIDTLMTVINNARLLVWKQQPAAFFEMAIIEADGSLVETLGACKQGIDLSYNKKWSYHPLLVSLANTQEPLFLLNRPGNRPSHEDAAAYFNRSVALCRQAGFRQILLRGDTDFSQTTYLDDWHHDGIGFVFGIDAMPNLVALACALPAEAWQLLVRPARYAVATQPRRHPDNVKEEIVRRRGYRNLRLICEHVAEFNYRPVACQRDYRIVVLRKHLVWERHGQVVEEETRYLFYITNQTWDRDRVVFFANDRCNQENLIQQLKNGVPALRAPVNTLEGNWAYMVIGALAWNLKVWLGLLQPKKRALPSLITMEFKKFLAEVMLLPCQIVRTGRQLIFRLLQWNPWVDLLCRVRDWLPKLQT